MNGLVIFLIDDMRVRRCSTPASRRRRLRLSSAVLPTGLPSLGTALSRTAGWRHRWRRRVGPGSVLECLLPLFFAELGVTTCALRCRGVVIRLSRVRSRWRRHRRVSRRLRSAAGLSIGRVRSAYTRPLCSARRRGASPLRTLRRRKIIRRARERTAPAVGGEAGVNVLLAAALGVRRSAKEIWRSWVRESV